MKRRANMRAGIQDGGCEGTCSSFGVQLIGGCCAFSLHLPEAVSAKKLTEKVLRASRCLDLLVGTCRCGHVGCVVHSVFVALGEFAL